MKLLNPFRIYNEVVSFIEMVKRMLFWGWKLRNSWDFDASTIWEMLNLKYTRIYNCMNKNGHLEWNKNENTKSMKRLRTMIVLTKRLNDEKYVDIADPTFWSEFHSNPNNKWDSCFDGETGKRFSRAVKNSRVIEEQDKEMFLKLFKHNDGWWD